MYPVCNFSENVDFRPRGDYGGPIRTKIFKLVCIEMSKTLGQTDRRGSYFPMIHLYYVPT